MARFIPIPSSIDKQIFKKCVILFCVLSIIIYGKSISNKYAMDDEYVTYNNQQVHGGISKIPEIFRTTYTTDAKASFEYRPIVKATYAIEYQFFGENPGISHFINILLYAFCVVFLFYFLLRLLPDYNYMLPLLVSLLFLVHPLHSEVVLSLKNRDVMLSFLGAMFSLLFYLRFVEGKGYLNLAGGFFFLLFAVLSKKDSMTFFVIIPFTLWFFRKVDRKQIGFILLSYLPVMVIFRTAVKSVVNDSVRTLLPWENPLFIHSTFFQRIPEGFYSIYFYLKMFIIPHPLIAYYGFDQAPIIGWGSIYVILILALFAAFIYFVVKQKAFRSVWVFGIVFFLITISMFTNVVVPVVGIVGERFAFIPSVGLCLAAAYGLLKYFRVPLENTGYKFKSLGNKVLITVAVIVLVFGGKSFSRNAAWKDAYTLYFTDAQVATESAHTHALLAAACISRIKKEPRMSGKEKKELVLTSEREYLESLRLIPDYTASHNNIGMLYYTYIGNKEKAIQHLKKAIQLDSVYQEAYFNLATCYASLNKLDTAEKLYQKVITINPNFAAAYTSLSNIYAQNKQYDKILALNQKALDKGIRSDAIYINMGNVYYMTGDTARAVPYLEKAIEQNPNNRGVNSFLSSYFERGGNKQKAVYYRDLLSRSGH